MKVFLVWPKDKVLTRTNHKVKTEFCQACTPYVQAIVGTLEEIEAIVARLAE
jgi:hypothetical protein